MRTAAERVASAREKNPRAVELARELSLASRVEPALVRRARLELAGATAGDEADLFHGPLVETATADGFTLRPDVAELLREELARDEAAYARARTRVREAHAELPSSVRVREEILALASSPDPADRGRAEDWLFAMMRSLPEGNDGLVKARWLATTALPSALEGTRETNALRLGAAVKMGRAADIENADLPADAHERWLPWLLPRSGAHYGVDATFRGGVLELVPDATPTASSDPERIALPATTPLVAVATWSDGSGLVERRLTLKPGEPRRLEVRAGRVDLRGLDGVTWRVALGEAPSSVVSVESWARSHEPFFGREEVLEKILQRHVFHGSGFQCILGSYGVGKSALLAKAYRELRKKGVLVVVYRITADPDRQRAYDASTQAQVRQAANELPRLRPRLFLSYAWKDRAVAERVATRLEARFSVFWRPSESLSRDELLASRERELASCDFAVVLLTQSSFDGEQVAYEIEALRRRFPPNHVERRMVAVRVGESNLAEGPFDLSGYSVVHFRSREPRELELEALVEVLGRAAPWLNEPSALLSLQALVEETRRRSENLSILVDVDGVEPFAALGIFASSVGDVGKSSVVSVTVALRESRKQALPDLVGELIRLDDEHSDEKATADVFELRGGAFRDHAEILFERAAGQPGRMARMLQWLDGRKGRRAERVPETLWRRWEDLRDESGDERASLSPLVVARRPLSRDELRAVGVRAEFRLGGGSEEEHPFEALEQRGWIEPSAFRTESEWSSTPAGELFESGLEGSWEDRLGRPESREQAVMRGDVPSESLGSDSAIPTLDSTRLLEEGLFVVPGNHDYWASSSAPVGRATLGVGYTLADRSVAEFLRSLPAWEEKDREDAHAKLSDCGDAYVRCFGLWHSRNAELIVERTPPRAMELPSVGGAPEPISLHPGDRDEWKNCLRELGVPALAALLRDTAALPLERRSRMELDVVREVVTKHGALLTKNPDEWYDLVDDAISLRQGSPAEVLYGGLSEFLLTDVVSLHAADAPKPEPVARLTTLRSVVSSGSVLVALTNGDVVQWGSAADDELVPLMPTGSEPADAVTTVQVGEETWILALLRNGEIWRYPIRETESELWEHVGFELTRRAGVITILEGSRGEVCAWGDRDGMVEILTVGSASLAGGPAHSGPVRALAVSFDGNTVASGGDDGRIVLWDVSTGREVESVDAHPGGVRDLTFASSPAGPMISAGADGAVRVWSMTLEPLDVLGGHTGPVNCVRAFGGRVASGGADGTVRVWRLEGDEPPRVFAGEGSVEGLELFETEDPLGAGYPRSHPMPPHDGSALVGHRANGEVFALSLDVAADPIRIGFEPSGRIRDAVWHPAWNAYVTIGSGLAPRVHPAPDVDGVLRARRRGVPLAPAARYSNESGTGLLAVVQGRRFRLVSGRSPRRVHPVPLGDYPGVGIAQVVRVPVEGWIGIGVDGGLIAFHTTAPFSWGSVPAGTRLTVGPESVEAWGPGPVRARVGQEDDASPTTRLPFEPRQATSCGEALAFTGPSGEIGLIVGDEPSVSHRRFPEPPTCVVGFADLNGSLAIAGADPSGLIRTLFLEGDDDDLTFDYHTGPVVELATDGQRLVSAGSDGLVCVWDAYGYDDPPKRVLRAPVPFVGVDIDPNSGEICATDETGGLWFLEPKGERNA